MSDASTLRVLGGGLAGSLLSIYLARSGFKVEVYERLPDMRKEDLPAGRSINLALAGRGLNALKHVGLESEVEKFLIPMRGRMIHELDGTVNLQPYGQREGEQIYSVSRPGLNMLLMNAAEQEHGVKFVFRQGCVDVDFDNNTANMVDLESGADYTVPIGPAFGCDGGGSAVRRAMVKRLGVKATEDMLEHDYKELTLPAGPDGKHQIETNALHIWPRDDFMLIALPNLDGSFTVTLFLQKEGPVSFEQLTTPENVDSFFAEVFPDAHALLPDLKTEFFANPTGFMGTVRTDRWYVDDKLVLLGDAAHAIVPFHGQGMNCAFEDCFIMGKILEEHETVDWAKVFPVFEEARKQNANAIADMALENYIEMRETVRNPKFQLMKEISWDLERWFPEYFVPRYSMVMFHTEIPYAEAKRRGTIQAQILEKLARGIHDPAEVSFEEAEYLVKKKLPEFEYW